jgi:aminodeoxyfutalosine synthase
VSAFSWLDVERLAASTHISDVVERLRRAGLDSLAEIPLDRIADPPKVLEALVSAGYNQIRLTIDKAVADARVKLFIAAAALQDAFPSIRSINPLPTTLGALRPTTGYDDVKSVAIARLAAPDIPTVQVDWVRYGPKLAQVALTFGADDIDNVSASDEAPDGRRRAPLEEVRRNIQAAGLEPAERDGRFALVS